MKTELKTVDASIVGGRKLDVIKYKVSNFRIHNVLEQVARLLIFCIESDSNNSNATVVPLEADEVWKQWAIVQYQYEYAKKRNNLPMGSHELAFEVLLPTGKEIQKIRNVKIKAVVIEIMNAVRVMSSTDSSRLQAYVSNKSQDDIKIMLDVVEEVMTYWLGKDGKEGVSAPPYERLGEIVPDVDSDYCQIIEPSAENPAPKLPDTPDHDEKAKK